MDSNSLKHIISFLFFSILQVLFFINFNIYEYGFAFIYIGFILFLPLNISSILLLILAFSQGLIIDLFYNTMGINTFALVLIAYLKPAISKLFIPRMIDDINDLKSINQLGIERSLLVIFILTFIHHLILFYVMNAEAQFFFGNFLKTIFSSIISTILLFSFKQMFFNKL